MASIRVISARTGLGFGSAESAVFSGVQAMVKKRDRKSMMKKGGKRLK
jgi:hypothetical protein